MKTGRAWGGACAGTAAVKPGSVQVRIRATAAAYGRWVRLRRGRAGQSRECKDCDADGSDEEGESTAAIRSACVSSFMAGHESS